MLQQAGLDRDWRAAALCANADPDLWFAPGAGEHKRAKETCCSCSVRSDCLAYAMDSPIDYGIWGGLTERERRRLRKEAGNGDWRRVARLTEPCSATRALAPRRPSRR